MGIIRTKMNFYHPNFPNGREVNVFQCEECKRFAESGEQEIFHDALCTSRGKVEFESEKVTMLIFDEHTEIYCDNCGRPVSSSNGEFRFTNVLQELSNEQTAIN